ncbi:choice-of-anchor U domain-containing protein, partial [Microcystis sp. M169S2]|uniref:beta strand repeat-containing protein n=1 Tax=Microcystis sp. M169S2 TaxID=2771157 RepID=UPI0025865EE3
GQTTGTVTFTIVDDALVEGTETATLTLTNPSSGLILGSTISQAITLTDNDFAPPEDGNFDGIPDDQQDNVLSLQAPNNQYVTFAAPLGQPSVNVQTTPNPDPANTPPNVDFSLGFFAFNLPQVTPGDATTITLFLPQGSTVNSYWKYGPTPDNPNPHWYDFTFDSLTNTGAIFQDINSDGQNEIILHFVDGQRGDEDLTANGEIIDPGAPAFTENLPNTPPTVINPITDVNVNEDSANTVIDLTNVFSDVDGDVIVKSVLTNDNTGLVTATIVNNQLTLDYQDNKFGTANITIRGTSNGKTVEDTFLVTVNPVDDAPTVLNPITDVNVNEDAANTVIDLSNVFSDPDGDVITKSVLSNTNTSLVTATIVNNQLILDYLQNQFGTAQITIRGTSKGLFIEDTFTITVNQVTEGILITGTSGNNNLVGGDGNDTLQGLAGNDTLNGGLGSDSLEGGNGNDVYYVDNSGDLVLETVTGSTGGTDLVYASVSYTLPNLVENLTLTGNSAINGTGNTLNNTIIGNNGNNYLLGDGGNDTLDGKAGVDTLDGGAGNDTYTIDNINDVIIDSAGTDTVSASISYTLAAGLENLTLTGNGNLNGTGNTLNNTIIGNNGNNYLLGDGGNDTLDGKAGVDTLDGGAGNDTYTIDNLNDVIIDSAGTDTVSAPISYTLADNLENLTLTGSTAINGTGNSANNTIIGNNGNNYLLGDGGNDTLDGKAGVDTLDGGAGNDTYTIDNLNDVIIDSAGTDTVSASISYTLADNLENLTLTGSTAINGMGNNGNNVITGNSGANLLSGLDSNDSLNGGNGNDTLLGGNGDDTLIGGTGNDSLTGGSGRDFFRYNSRTEGIDTITDFNVLDDTVLVSRSGFSGGLTVGTLLNTQLTTGTSATTSAHRFIYNASNGQLWYDIDGTGTTAASQIATLSPTLALTASNFVVF